MVLKGYKYYHLLKKLKFDLKLSIIRFGSYNP